MLLLAFTSVLGAPALATIHHPGKWTTPIRWKKDGTDLFKETAVNMSLLALPDTLGQTRAQVVWWQDDHVHESSPFGRSDGGIFNWRPPSDSLLAAGTFPDTSASTGTFQFRRYPSPGYDIFCSGMTPLEEDQGYGRLLVVGGTVEAENGSPEAAIYNARTNTWDTTATNLSTGRWYPSATRLATGKVLVTSGSRYGQMWLFGGGSQTDSSFHFNPITHDPAQMWNESQLPLENVPSTDGTRASPRRGHSAVWEIGGMLAMYGGIHIASNELLNDCWTVRRGDNPDQEDYKYNYEARLPNDANSPGKLAYHTSLVLPVGDLVKFETLLLVGGQKALTGPSGSTDRVWAGRLVSNTHKIQWIRLLPTLDSDPFPARFGHASVWEPGQQRLYVYGGVAEPGQQPGDRDVYSMEIVSDDNTFDLDSTFVRWRKCTVVNADSIPLPRAFMASGGLKRLIPLTATTIGERTGLAFYGGRTATGTVSDSMFVVWPTSADTVRWQRVPQAGTHPALEYASGTSAENMQEFWVLGGKDGSGDAQSAMMSAHLHCQGCQLDTLTARWVAREAAAAPVWGHTLPRTPADVFARTSEIYDPETNAFTTLYGAWRREDWYPQTFTVPEHPDKVFMSGPLDSTWVLTFGSSTGGWSDVPNTNGQFRGASAVTYRPGKILKCGSRDTDGPGPAIGTTKLIDFSDLDSTSPAWASSGSMLPRVNHNLTVLPDGKVLVTGGTDRVNNQNNNLPVRRPELWDPSGDGGLGAWEGGNGVGMQLDTSDVARGYHSTALLLPDGRVLCGGGNATNEGTTGVGMPWQDDQYRMDLYSPPYLFNTDGTAATRPQLRTAPRRVTFGQPFVVSVGGSDLITSGCLIAPGATTHGYDENQRYIPLTFTQVGPIDPNTRYYRTDAPGDSSVAPPGDYLLFVLNSLGTPAIARWVRVSSTTGGTEVPTTVTDLGRECINGTGIRLKWTPPGCNVGDTVLTQVSQYDLRMSTTSISADTSFDVAIGLAPPDSLGDPLGSPVRKDTLGLIVGTTYYFRLRARNWASATGNWSEMSNQFVWTVHNEECGGSGGGGGGGGSEYEVRIRPGAQLNSAFGRPGGSSVPDTAYLENTLLPNAPLNTTLTDRIRLPFGPRWTESGARVRLSRSGTRSTHFDRVRLLAADYVEGEGVFVRGGELLSGVTHDPVRVVHADGRDLTATFLAGGAFEGTDNDTLYAEFGGEGAGSFVLSTSRAQLVRAPDRTGIDLACETAQGWVAVGHHEVREHANDEVFDTPSLHRIRLVFHGVHRLDGIARLTPGQGVTVTTYDPVSAEHSRLGDVAADLAGDGSTLAAGDNLVADFAAPPPPAGTLRDWYLEVVGAHMEGGGGAQGAKLDGRGQALPTVFALARSRPNPFSGQATIGFDVPVRTHVRLEVFDVQGRRVAMLADRPHEPGRYSVAWDGRTSAGTLAHAGVYLCRMTAGSFHREQHVVLIR